MAEGLLVRRREGRAGGAISRYRKCGSPCNLSSQQEVASQRIGFPTVATVNVAADLDGVDLSGANLTGATIYRTELNKACGTGAKLDPGLTIKPCPK